MAEEVRREDPESVADGQAGPMPELTVRTLATSAPGCLPLITRAANQNRVYDAVENTHGGELRIASELHQTPMNESNGARNSLSNLGRLERKNTRQFRRFPVYTCAGSNMDTGALSHTFRIR